MAEENKDKQAEAEERKVPTVVDELVEKFGAAVVADAAFRDEMSVRVESAELIKALTYLFKERRPAFNMLIDVCGVDYPDREKRFDVVYHLLCMENGERLRVKIAVADGEDAPTITPLWNSADWQEREVFDMFGVRFAGHPNMTRILMWDGYEGYPLRKDYPLKGNTPQAERYHDKDIRQQKDMKQYCWEGYCTDL